MTKVLFFFLLCMSCLGQRLHHQAVTSQGVNVKIANNVSVLQSVGQSSVIGNYKAGTIIIGQGFIQSKTKNSIPISNETASVVVYPNPVVDFVTFKFSAVVELSAKLFIFDSRGRLVYTIKEEVLQNTLTVDLSQLAQGVYFAKIETTNHSFSTKILKSK